MVPAGPRQGVRFGALRAEAVLTAVEVTRRVTERQGLDPANGAAVRRVTGTVRPALRRLEGKSVKVVPPGSRKLDGRWRAEVMG